ncbi:MAG TPA: hypothetical protein EYN51_00685, partial [Flavobacteriales bacterium]|nr:hypothetical protein [Flavobacteriales bacterium]
NVTYVFSTCGNSAFDTYITLLNDTNGALLAFNDDDCALQSTITWTAQANGTVRVLIDEYAGLFNTCAHNTTCMTLNVTQIGFCGGGGSGPNNDCVTATPICDNDTFPDNNSGPGLNDFTNSNNNPGCLLANEHQSAWYYLQIAVGGTLGFTLNPMAGSGEDYDFAIYGPNVACNNLGSPQRCSYADQFCGFCPQTGLGMGATDFSEPPSGDGFVAMMNVNAGEIYYMLIDNYLATTLGFSLTWTGTAILHCSNGHIIYEVSQTDVVCNGMSNGAIDINVTSGTPPFSYAWSNGATTQNLNNIPVGTYTVTVTDATSATDVVTVTITQPATFNFSATSICLGDSTALSINITNTSVIWSTGETTSTITVTPTQTTTYQVTIYDSITICSDSITVTVNGLPIVDIGPDTFSHCGYSFTFDAGSGFSAYTWNTGANTQTIAANVSGTYMVTVTDSNGCISSDATFLSIVTANITASASIICSGQSDTLSVNPGYYSYLWSSGSTSYSTIVTMPGQYSITITDFSGCTSIDSFIIQELKPIISTSGPVLCVSSINLQASQGFIAYQWNTGETSPQITVSQSGTYSLVGITSDGCVAVSDPYVVTIIPPAVATIAVNGNSLSSSPAAVYQWYLDNTALHNSHQQT